MTNESSQAIIVRELEAMPVGQRAKDGYINATAMCEVAGKLWGNYRQLQGTQDFLEELGSDIGIPISLLTHSVRGGRKDEQGTWVHPMVAVNLAQWCSPRFAVKVSGWVVEWATTGDNPMQKIPMLSLYDNPSLQKAMSNSYHHYLSRINGDFVYSNADLCHHHSDWHWFPKQYKEYAKRLGGPAKERTSGLQVLRKAEPPSAGAITAEKWALMCGAKEPAARAIGDAFKEVGRLCLAAGIHTVESQIDAGSKQGTLFPEESA